MAVPMFDNLKIAVARNNIFGKRYTLFENLITKHGGTWIPLENLNIATHIVFDESFLTNKKSLQDVLNMVSIQEYDNLTSEVVSTKWLAACVKEKKIVDVDSYRFQPKVEDEIGW